MVLRPLDFVKFKNQTLIIGIEEYGDVLVLEKFKTNWMVRLREHSHTGTQHMSITCYT